MSSSSTLKFGPLSSSVHPAFWSVFSKKKLEELGLDESPVNVYGTYTNSEPKGLPASVTLEWNAFNPDEIEMTRNTFIANGRVLNKNTIDSFKTCDKRLVLENEAKRLWDMYETGRIFDEPASLSRFIVLMYADLKKFIYYFWFAFPSFNLPDEISLAKEPEEIGHLYSSDVVSMISKTYDTWKRVHQKNSGFFGIDFVDDFQPRILTLRESIDAKGSVIFAFIDPWNKSKDPGWPMRNLIALIHARKREKINGCKILSLRSSADGKSIETSLIYTLSAPGDLKPCKVMPKCFGWEPNEKGQMGPRVANMKSTLDPKSISESAVNLNLKLMKWRLVPKLDLEKFSELKCLLLGSGTLGCNVARSLLGWGVKHITFVDNGKVSYSNPVRQSLFTFEDCLDGGKPKAAAASERLCIIHPGAIAKHHNLTVPMPGHQISDSLIDEVQRNFIELEKLIQVHDVIFLLMDTRESRWLPTVIGASYDKLVINAALGFDSFLVMRHGARSCNETNVEADLTSKVVAGDRLGCYFCNDIVAPGNSTKDRTLDQQCTVTRPGVSMMASGLAVELMSSVLQHPKGTRAPALASPSNDSSDDSIEGLLGIVPHSLRGFLGTFQQISPTTSRFSQCIACSISVIKEFREGKFQFLKNVCNNPSYLEELVGLSQLLDESKLDDVLEISDDESVSSKSSYN